MATQPSLADLIKTAQAGDRASFEEIVARFQSPLKTVIGFQLGEILKRRVEVEDVLQETLMRAFKSLPDLEWWGEDSFFRWLTSISRHVVWKVADRNKRERAVPLDSDFENTDPSQSKALRREERFARLQEALDTLSPEQQQVVLLARVDRIPITEIARRTGRSPNAVSHLLLRALQRLRREFGDTESLGLPDIPLRRRESQSHD
jgi:RNA polymerase sigma-70 factor (ECF subfamily)